MQYFVSAENSSYFYWQLELLIESFVMQGLEKNLVISLAENNQQKIRGFSSNLVKYGNKFMHENEGQELDYLPINRINALRHAVENKLLSFPFVLIHSDMILKNPITLSEKDDDFGIIINNYDEVSENESKIIDEELKPSIKKLATERKINFEKIPRVPFFCAPVIFNKSFEYVAPIFFSRLHENLINILKKQGKTFPCEKAAWQLTITESFQHCSVKGEFLAAPLLFESEQVNFIHYKTGIPPVFHKRFFDYKQGVYFNGQGPYEALLEHNPTVNTNFLHQVIRSYNRKNH
jgi:hypothetical protein